MLLWASVRPAGRAWVEELTVAAVAFGSLPLLNALTTDRHLGVTIPTGNWVLASFDLTALATGILFGIAAIKVHRKSRADRRGQRRSITGRSALMSGRRTMLRYRWSVASRILAVLGGYGFISLLAMALALCLPMPRFEAVMTAIMVSFIAYAAIIMAVFHERSVSRVWAWLVVASIPLAIISLLLWSSGST